MNKIKDFSIQTLYRVRNIEKKDNNYFFDLIEWKTQNFPEKFQKKVHLQIKADNKKDLINKILRLRKKQDPVLKELRYSMIGSVASSEPLRIISYSKDIDRLLKYPSDFLLSEDESDFININEIDNDKIIDLSINFNKGKIKAIGYFSSDILYIHRFDAYPKTIGLGKEALIFYKQKLKKRYPLFVDVSEKKSSDFWRKMFNQDLIDNLPLVLR